MDQGFVRKIEKALSFLESGNFGDFRNLARKHPAILTERVGDCSLIHEAFFRSREICKTAILNGADVNISDTTGSVVLNMYAERGDLEMVLFLLNNGALVNKIEALGETALSWSIVGEHVEVAKILIAYGADMNHTLSLVPKLTINDLAEKSRNLEIRKLSRAS